MEFIWLYFLSWKSTFFQLLQERCFGDTQFASLTGRAAITIVCVYWCWGLFLLLWVGFLFSYIFFNHSLLIHRLMLDCVNILHKSFHFE